MSKIEVIGLGAGGIDQLPLGIYRKLTSSESPIFIRTMDHPVVADLQKEGCTFIAFDSVYEQHDRFEQVYEQIVETLISESEDRQEILYAVPGHPMLAEKTVQLLLEQQKVSVEVTGGQSFLDDLFTALKIDPIEGFQFVDATAFSRSQLNYRHHLIFCQVYDAFVASEVKLTLLDDLSPDHPVNIVEAVGSEKESITTVPLSELDHATKLSNLTSVYVPPVTGEDLNHQFFRLREIISILRGPNGCPWDKKQTHESLRKYLLEEVYEFIEAVNAQDDQGMVEEIGDVLLQVMLHSQIGEDEGYFTIDDVIKSITDKMIRRHPHVFGEVNVNNADDVVTNWDKIKKEEKGVKRKSLLDGIPPESPNLLVAEQLQKKAAKVGFDWDNPKPMWEKVIEEINEVKEAIQSKDQPEIEKEFGDLLFAIVNLTRYYKVNPELALYSTNTKFKSRFQYMEKQIKEQNLSMEKMSLEQLDTYWELAKKQE
ncbi:bifunctional methyltransferase/pyrophosphohydrolase YabN [Aquibacillus kalidii]|uniref:nucleoside triphosphate pyrophosphohydrolase n=1 Tax=Aquibacillus kalidii TaxID=2762597 RepID=UPI001644F2EC|nr:nucleoside triphosphate pyrophosphohydrolase [Aquibacillus kalidii]